MEISISDLRLQSCQLDDLERLARLRKKNLEAKAEVCIERARYVTQYLAEMSADSQPVECRYACAVSHFLNNKATLFPDDNLLAGTTTSKYFGAPVYPEWTGLTIWPELDTISKRKKNPQELNNRDAEELNFKIFPYWMERNILERTRAKYKNPRRMRLFERIVFFLAGKAGTISHTVPEYREVLAKGVKQIVAKAASKEAALKQQPQSDEVVKQIHFYQAVQTAMAGVVAYAKNLSVEAARLAEIETDPQQKSNLEAMAAVCAQVPENPARTFREAVNSLWLMQISIHAENINMAISPGRLDQILYPYYRKDMDNGTLTEKQALELVGCLWLKLNDNTNLVPETAEELFGGAGTVPAVTLGGVDEQGEDAVNDLTYIMLRVTELLKTRDPSVNARYHYKKNPDIYRDRVAEVIATTKAVPAFHNDVADIKTLVNQGQAIEHARDYAIIGCVELASSGRSYDASSSIMFNLPSALELALFDGRRPATGREQIGPRTGGPDDFTSFADFWTAFKTQLSLLLEEAIELN
ncbi:MAG: pyruvate formate lyase family protein, partial [Desulfuromonadales bacterium]|nr:pyruvate formate lyase family protein [Desulfuromonadales bacterium]